VTGKRDNGYHDLAMIMQRVGLYDQLFVELIEEADVRVVCPGLELAEGEPNIVEKAARMFLERVGSKCGVRIAVEKQIPAAAGLGGGSSDAAAVLTVLNDLLKTNLPQSELMEMGLRLGADVPFFLYGQTAWATGVGERLQPWPGVPPVTLVLVNPHIAVSTSAVFQNLGLTRQGAVARIPRFPVGTNGLVRLLHNDLEVVTCHHHPVITTIKERLVANGAAGALMSGSGPTVFGVFDERSRAEESAQEISRDTEWWVKVVNPL
jgi:4-diphosphocytidyl-2-C-methyl-D-erythritol kinase